MNKAFLFNEKFENLDNILIKNIIYLKTSTLLIGNLINNF